MSFDDPKPQPFDIPELVISNAIGPWLTLVGRAVFASGAEAQAKDK